MRTLGIDIETYSSNDLTKCGVYKYVEADDFAILLFAYSVDGGDVRCVDVARGESLPDDVLHALTDPKVKKTAYNAAFERVCIGRWLGVQGRLDPAQWHCTMVAAARLGLPLSLAKCAEALRLEKEKMTEGRALIRFFSVPRNGKRNMPDDAPEKWAVFKAYNIRDVEVEQAILRKIEGFDTTETERALYITDQRINDRGVLVDLTMAKNAARMNDEYNAELLDEAAGIMRTDSPNSITVIKDYIQRTCGQRPDTLSKKSLDELEKELSFWPKAQRVLQIRREVGKTSNAKYGAIVNCACHDNRVRGLLQFYGAARTGRWAGRLVQMQNLPQNHLNDIDHARRIVQSGSLDDLELEYDRPTQVLSELIRTAFIAKTGSTFIVCDFSAIEARVIAWLTGEEWVLDTFRRGGDIYCETASKMFGVPVEKHGQNKELRQKGKIAVLALGYGGGVAALEAMGGSRLGLTQDEERDIVKRWRASNKHIVQFWDTIERMAVVAIQKGIPIQVQRGVQCEMRRGFLFITLPSGRCICYPRAKVETEDVHGHEKPSITYEGSNQTTGKWEQMRTYGGKLTENVVQATARDILGEVLLRAERAGMDVVFHVHDEIIVEAKPGQTLADVERIFNTPIDWCKTLPLKGDGYTTPYYLKQ